MKYIKLTSSSSLASKYFKTIGIIKKHIETNNGVEGRGEKEDNVMRTKTETREYENGGGGDAG